MMLGKQKPALPVVSPSKTLQVSLQKVSLEQFLPDSQRHRHAEGAQASLRHGRISLQQSFELQKMLVIADHIIKLIQDHTYWVKAAFDRNHLKTWNDVHS